MVDAPKKPEMSEEERMAAEWAAASEGGGEEEGAARVLSQNEIHPKAKIKTLGQI